MIKSFSLNQIKSIIQTSNIPTGNQLLDARYESHNTQFGHHWPYYRILYQLAKLAIPTLSSDGIELPSVIVELGGWQGTAAAHLAGGNPDAMVITVDHLSDPGDDKNRIKMKEAEDQFNNLLFMQGWTWDVCPKIKLIASQGIDILFIDSWHDYDHAMRDWNDYKPLLNSPSLIICDDIIGGYGPVISGMEDFWVDIMKDCDNEGFLDTDIHPGSAMGFLKYDKKT